MLLESNLYRNGESVNACEGAECQGCDNCVEYSLAEIMGNVVCQADIDARPDRESPDYLAQLFLWAHKRGYTQGMGAVDLAAELGHTDGNPEHQQPPESIPDSRNRASLVIALLDGIRESGIDPYRHLDHCPPLPPSLIQCPNRGWSAFRVQCASGKPHTRVMDCASDDCVGCISEYRRGKLHRYAHGINDETQTIMTISGLDPESAKACRRYLTDKFRQPHVTVATEHADSVTLTLIAASELELSYWPVMERYTAARVAVRLRMVKPSEVGDLITTQHKIGGILNPVTFSHWLKDYPTQPDYQFSDPVPLAVADDAPVADYPHSCDDCDAVISKYPNNHSDSLETRAINREYRNQAFATRWLSGRRISYHDLTDMAAAWHGGDAQGFKAAYQRVRLDSAYYGPRSLFRDAAAAMQFSEHCATERNPRGAYLPADTTLAMLVVMEHVNVMG